MKTLKKLLTTPFQSSNLNRQHKGIIVSLVALAAIGFADATYLTVEHFRNVIPPCTTTGCATVLTSDFATIFGVPVALIGAIYYLILLVLLIAFLDIKHERFLRTAMFMTTIGFVMSIYFVSLQAFVIHSYCQYCLVSAAISTTLFAISAYTYKKYHHGAL